MNTVRSAHNQKYPIARETKTAQPTSLFVAINTESTHGKLQEISRPRSLSCPRGLLYYNIVSCHTNKKLILVHKNIVCAVHNLPHSVLDGTTSPPLQAPTHRASTRVFASRASPRALKNKRTVCAGTTIPITAADTKYNNDARVSCTHRAVCRYYCSIPTLHLGRRADLLLPGRSV